MRDRVIMAFSVWQYYFFSFSKPHLEPYKDVPLRHWPTADPYLTLSMLGKNFSTHFEIFFLCFPENSLWQFMQIVSLGDNLQEMLKPIFICWLCPESGND